MSKNILKRSHTPKNTQHQNKNQNHDFAIFEYFGHRAPTTHMSLTSTHAKRVCVLVPSTASDAADHYQNAIAL